MIAGAVTSEQKVKVELDPELKVSAADLQTQRQTLERISTLIRGAGDMLREANRHADAEDWNRFRTGLAASRLSEQLQALSNLIDGANDPPTQAMTKLLGELESAYQRSTTEFQALKR